MEGNKITMQLDKKNQLKRSLQAYTVSRRLRTEELQ